MASKRPYHHGDLKPALLRAAIELIAEVGPAAFTLREVARRAGISHNAPYRHFRDKDDLLAAVATEGFERLAKALAQARPGSAIPAAKGRAGLSRLQMSGVAYVKFALRFPEHLLVMFDWPLARNRYPALATAGSHAFSILVGLVREAQQEGSLPPGDPILQARIAWSMVHGVSKLAIGGRLPLASDGEVVRFAAQAIDALHKGMANWRGHPGESTLL